MTFLTSLAILGGAIVFLIAVQMLRNVMSLTLPRLILRPLPESTPTPAALRDFLDDYRETLAELDGPYWMLAESERSGLHPPLVHALYRLPGEHTVLMLGPAVDANLASQPVMSVTSFLADGGEAVSEANSFFDTLLAGPDDRVQRVATSGPAGLLEQHREWLEHQQLEPAIRRIPLKQMYRQLDAAYHSRLDRLIERGLLKAIPGGAKLSWRAGLTTLRLALTQPKQPGEQRPIPLERLKLLVGLQELHKYQRPLSSVQWTLFALSGLLFVLLGAWFWDLYFALVLAGVIVFHELGHYLAMRAFGYRQVHMLFVPLAGGITVGVEEKPDSVHRAWISLMGPVPGIALGWGLLIAGFTLGDWALALVMPAFVLLFVNYLNLLPVPPLDGGQLMQVLLPVKRYKVRVALVAVTCLAGIAVSWWLGYYLLAMIAAFGVLGVGGIVKLGEVFERQQLERAGQGLDSTQRRLLALEALERDQGPTENAKERLSQAVELAANMGLKTPPLRHQLAIVGLYVALFALPVSAGVLTVMGWQSGWGGDTGVDYQAYQQRAEAEVAGMAFPELLTEWAGERSGDAPVAFGAAQTPPETLPGQLADWYARAWPEGLGVVPVGQLTRGEDCAGELLEEWASAPLLTAVGPSQWGEDFATDPAGLGEWWCPLVGESPHERLLVAPEGDDLYPGYSVVDLSRDILYPDLTAYLRAELREARVNARLRRDHRERQAQVQRELAAQDVAGLVAAMPRQPWLMRLIGGQSGPPGPADSGAIDAAQQRLGMRLPPEYRQLLALHNGHPDLGILPVEQVRRLSDWPMEDEYRTRLYEEVAQALALSAPEACLVVEAPGWHMEQWGGGSQATLLYCGEGDSGVFWSLFEPTVYERYSDRLRESVAQRIH